MGGRATGRIPTVIDLSNVEDHRLELVCGLFDDAVECAVGEDRGTSDTDGCDEDEGDDLEGRGTREGREGGRRIGVRREGD